MSTHSSSTARAQPVERDHAAQLRQERRQAAVAPVGHSASTQLVARDRPQAVRDDEREQQPALTSRQLALDATVVELDDEPAAELNFPTRQVRANIDPTPGRTTSATRSKGAVMAKQITCECGYVIRGETDGEVVRARATTCVPTIPICWTRSRDADLHGWIEEV